MLNSSTAQALERSALDFALASVLTTYPDAEQAEAARVLVEAGAGGRAESGVLELARSLGDPEQSGQQAATYIDLLDRGPQRVSLYETEHGRMRGPSKGNELADIAGFYQAFGLDLSEEDGSKEMADHLAVELEFYSVLLGRQAALGREGDAEGCQVVEQARRGFLVDHLGRLADAIGRTTVLVGNLRYGAVFRWCAHLVADECAALSVSPVPLEIRADQSTDEDLSCCGAVAGAASFPGPQT